MRVLGIETSCDETAAAVVEYSRGRFSVLSNVVASQMKLHAKTGGVVPEVAAREHVQAIIPVIQQALEIRNSKSEILNPEGIASRSYGAGKFKIQNSKLQNIDVIAVTMGPGLITSLRIGVDVARTLAYLWKKPLVAVNHLEGHIYASWLMPVREIRNPKSEILNKFKIQNSKFPILCLIVSGGHTELVLMKKHLDYKIIGATRDDAAGEAFDKVAKMLGLGYPGGPAVSRLAEKGDPYAIAFPRPMIDSNNFDFSFAGLKTAVLYYLKKNQDAKIVRPDDFGIKKTADVCASFEQAVVDVLVAKTIRAAKKYRVKTVLLGGGVAANRRLRDQLGSAINYELRVTPKESLRLPTGQASYELPDLDYTGDNAAMIAAAGVFHALKKDFTPWEKIEVDPNASL